VLIFLFDPDTDTDPDPDEGGKNRGQGEGIQEPCTSGCPAGESQKEMCGRIFLK
jgi:hypothetical protein